MNVISMNDLAAEMKIKVDQIRYWGIDRDVIPKPTKFLGRLVYSPEDAETVRKFFRSRAPYERN